MLSTTFDRLSMNIKALIQQSCCISTRIYDFMQHSSMSSQQSPRLLDQVRESIRLKHFSLSTEKSYVYVSQVSVALSHSETGERATREICKMIPWATNDCPEESLQVQLKAEWDQLRVSCSALLRIKAKARARRHRSRGESSARSEIKAWGCRRSSAPSRLLLKRFQDGFQDGLSCKLERA